MSMMSSRHQKNYLNDIEIARISENQDEEKSIENVFTQKQKDKLMSKNIEREYNQFEKVMNI